MALDERLPSFRLLDAPQRRERLDVVEDEAHRPGLTDPLALSVHTRRIEHVVRIRGIAKGERE